MIGCHADLSSLTQPLPDPSEAPFIQFIEKTIGTDWYGIYALEGKVGHLHSTLSREKGPDGPRYRIQLDAIIQVSKELEVDPINLQSTAEFKAQPPFSMIYFSEMTIHGNDTAETKIVLTPKGYEAIITQGRQPRSHMLGSFDYSLKDHTAVQRWISQNPEAGAKIKYPYLNSETLTLEEHTSLLERIDQVMISGVKTFYYNVVTTGFNDLEVQEEFGADGRPYRILLGGVFECRLESKALATHIDRSVTLFLKNTVAVDRPLGASGKITFLKLSLDTPSGTLLDNAPGQSIVPSATDDSVIVTLNAKGFPSIPATDKEIKRYSAATVDIPARHPVIMRHSP